MDLLGERLARAGRDEAGFTLVELLVATMLGLVVIGAAVTAFTASIQTQPSISSRASQVQQARVAMERITRELRQGQGWGSGTSNPSQLSVVTYSADCGATRPCEVTYSCTAGTCTRRVGQGQAVQVVTGLATSDVFSYQSVNSPPVAAPTPTTDYVNITLPFPAESGDDAITLQDGVELRNHS